MGRNNGLDYNKPSPWKSEKKPVLRTKKTLIPVVSATLYVNVITWSRLNAEDQVEKIDLFRFIPFPFTAMNKLGNPLTLLKTSIIETKEVNKKIEKILLKIYFDKKIG